MTGREKTLAALSGEGSPFIGAGVCYASIYIRDAWDRLTDKPWWVPYWGGRERIESAYLDIYARLDYDWIPVSGGFAAPPEDETVTERPDGAYRVNLITGEERRLVRPPVGGFDASDALKPQNGAPVSREGVDSAVDADPSIADEGPSFLSVFLRKNFPDRCPEGYVCSPFTKCFYIWGYEQTMKMAYDDPVLLEYACGKLAETAFRELRRERSNGAEFVWVEECYSDMVSAAHYGRFCLPYLRRLCGEIRALGMKSVFYYTGDPKGKMDLLLQSGADMIGFEESKKGFKLDIIELAEAVRGRMGLLGNLDAINLLPACTHEELRAALTVQAEAAKIMKGRFIFGIGSPLTPGTSVERAGEYVEAAREIGRNIWTRN